MNNFLQRTLLFIVTVPLILSIIIFLDRFSHIGWILLIVIVSLFGSIEALFLFLSEPRSSERFLIPLLAFLLPLGAALDILFSLPFSLFLFLLIFGISTILLFYLVIWKKDTYYLFPAEISLAFAALLYPALFTSFLIRFALLPNALPLMLLFLLLNFGNDTSAYLTGKFLGKHSRNLFEVSPQKTLVGFIGGFAGSIILGSVFTISMPTVFTAPWSSRLLLFFFTALLANIGDLIESALKRSIEKKDSGSLIPGRGGVLDSIDSLLFSAPFFYYSSLIILV